MEVFSRCAVYQPLLEFMQHRNSPISSSICRIHQICEVGNRMVIVEGSISQLLQQTGLQLYGNLLKLNDSNMVSLLECFPEPG